MTVARALREGASRLGGAMRVVFLFYAATAGAALVAVLALMTVAWESLGHSLWAPRMMANFDIEWVAELAARYGRIAAMPIVATVLLVLVAFAAVCLFLVGGGLEVLCAGGTSFFGGCSKHFWRLVRLTVWTGICAIVLIAGGGLMGELGARVWGEGSAAGQLVYWSWFRAAVVLAGLAMIKLAFDYAAIEMAVEDSRHSFGALLDAFWLIVRNPGKALGLSAVLWLLLAVSMGIGAGVSRMAVPASMSAVVGLFLFRQAAVLAKTWCWLLFFPAQAAMWRALRPAVEAERAWAGVEPAGEVAIIERATAPVTEELPPQSE